VPALTATGISKVYNWFFATAYAVFDIIVRPFTSSRLMFIAPVLSGSVNRKLFVKGFGETAIAPDAIIVAVLIVLLPLLIIKLSGSIKTESALKPI